MNYGTMPVGMEFVASNEQIEEIVEELYKEKPDRMKIHIILLGVMRRLSIVEHMDVVNETALEAITPLKKFPPQAQDIF